MAKFTKKKIEKIATAIREFLDEHYLNGDCRIYFNGICWEHGSEDEPMTWDKEAKDYIDVPYRTGWKTLENEDPKRYFEYATGFISMSFEGSLYDVLNGWSQRDFRLQDEFLTMLEKYDCYYELGNAWNLSIYES